jgi:hypothetical protein
MPPDDGEGSTGGVLTGRSLGAGDGVGVEDAVGGAGVGVGVDAPPAAVPQGSAELSPSDPPHATTAAPKRHRTTTTPARADA